METQTQNHQKERKMKAKIYKDISAVIRDNKDNLIRAATRESFAELHQWLWENNIKYNEIELEK